MKELTPQIIRDYVNEIFDTDISVKNRKAFYIECRWIYYCLCLTYGDFTYSEISTAINRVHATAINGIVEFKNYYNYNSEFNKKVNSIKEEFEKRFDIEKNIDHIVFFSLTKTDLVRRLKKSLKANRYLTNKVIQERRKTKKLRRELESVLKLEVA